MIEARHLTKTFKDKKRGVIRAVDDVSFTCQPGRTPSFLKLCQPVKLWPSNSSCQPAACSALVKVLIGCGAEVNEAQPAASMTPMVSERIFFIMEIARHNGRRGWSVSINSWQLSQPGQACPKCRSV